METDPNDKGQQAGSDDAEPDSTEGPGSVTVDEPTDPALSGTSKDDFKGTDAEESGKEEDS